MAKATADEIKEFGTPPGQIVFEEKSASYNLQLVIADDELSATASIRVYQKKDDLIRPTELLSLLSDHGIIDGINMENLKRFCQSAADGKDQNHVILALTSPPQPGADGWIEPLIRTARDAASEFVEDENGRVDLYTLNLFTSVQPEQDIAILHPPQLGEASSTVTGKVLAPLLGKELEIRLGSGVRVEDDGTRFVSLIAGRADLTENILSVSEDYIIHGDVDLEVGNINFPGFAQVRGDVLDNFDIHAEKGISISGAVGACHLITAGDVTIGSMSGHSEGLIRCGGNLKANYLNGISVECLGSVTVVYEIRNCIVKSADRILIKNGTISGGSCVALNGIEARDVGAEAGTLTRLCSGVYFPEEDRLQMLKTQQKSIAIQDQFIHQSLGPLNKEALNDHSTTGAIKKRLEILLERLELLKLMKKDVQRELNNFVFEDHPGNAKINIHRRLKEKVTIVLGTVSEEIHLEHQGPLSVVADVVNNRLRICEMSPLSLNADEMEFDEEPPAHPAAEDELTDE